MSAVARIIRALSTRGKSVDYIADIVEGLLGEDGFGGRFKRPDMTLNFVARCAENTKVDPRWLIVVAESADESWPAWAPQRSANYFRVLPSNWSELRESVLERDGRKCVYCGDLEGPFHVDHIVPLRHGGTSDLGNLAVACRTCNLSKKDRSLAEWRGVGK